MKNERRDAPYRSRKRYLPTRYQHKRPGIPHGQVFSNNVAQGWQLHNKDHDNSVYVERKLIMIDRFGNKQIAQEVQFLNSGANIGRIYIDGGDKERKPRG